MFRTITTCGAFALLSTGALAAPLSGISLGNGLEIGAQAETGVEGQQFATPNALAIATGIGSSTALAGVTPTGIGTQTSGASQFSVHTFGNALAGQSYLNQSQSMFTLSGGIADFSF